MTERAWANAWALSLSGGDATSTPTPSTGTRAQPSNLPSRGSYDLAGIERALEPSASYTASESPSRTGSAA
jgi:hypothetical protein